MSISSSTAASFAHEWIAAWNKHDIDAILSHYTDNVLFYSPFIPLLKFNDTGVITSKEDLKKYFEIGLKNFPDLYFDLHEYFVGTNTVVLYYTSVNGRKALEVFELNEAGKATKVYCNYAESKTV